MALTVRGNSPNSVFGINGFDENSATYALGWVLEQSATFAKLLLDEAYNAEIDISNLVITLQKHGSDGGYTDIELHAGHQFHAVLEAKRWWEVAGIEQLKRYLPRLQASNAQKQLLISVSASSRELAMRKLPSSLDGIDVVHFSWSDLQKLAIKTSKKISNFEEKLWLRQLVQHLGEYISMNRETSNMVYVVAISNGKIKESGQPWIDVVEKDKRYFHIIGNTWPKEPPNYIGFRYQGILLSIHHIDSFDIVENLKNSNENWPETHCDHFVYTLSPPIKPTVELKSGNVYGPGHDWCAIDTLLSGAYKTVSEARDETKKRLALPE